MKNNKQYLLLQQTDKKITPFKAMSIVIVPSKGWVNAFRIALKMSLRQLGNRLSISPQSVKEIEEREANGTITLNRLREVANALDMQFVYGFVSKHDSLESMIEKRAKQLAIEIVMRTNNTMALEDQQNSKERIEQAIAQKTSEIKREMPKYLWD
jgi:predicted DNA-binding mobile mystery protein A